MNYLQHYKNLIEKRKNIPLDKNHKTHKHHIIPKSLEKNNYGINILKSLGQIGEKIPLLLEEHWIAHLLLIKIFDEKSEYHNKKCYQKMLRACHRMLTSKKYGEIKNNKEYKWIREEVQKGENNPMYNKPLYALWLNKYGKDIADQKLLKWKEHLGEHEAWNKGLKKENDERVKKYSEKLSGIEGKNVGKNNPMFGKSVYDTWLKKYGKNIADQKLNALKEKYNKRIPWNKGLTKEKNKEK